MKSLKQTLKFLLLIAIFAVVPSTIALAHGPETYKNSCTEQNLNLWFADSQGPASGPCDPANPTNISSGVTSEYGGTTKNYPYGLCYPSFNNYTDEIDNNYFQNHGVEIGMDPYGSTPPLFKDERNFFKARKIPADTTDNGTWADYQDAITIKEGDKARFMIYIHNDGDPCFNDNNSIPQGKFYSNWKTTSRNTKVNVAPNFTVKDGKISLKINNETGLEAGIWSDNARAGNGTIAPIRNNVSVTPQNNEELSLEYVEGTAFYTDYDTSWNWNEHAIQNPQNLFNANGMQLSTLLNGNVKGSSGDYYASEPYIGAIVFTLEAKKEQITPPVTLPKFCGELKIDHPAHIYKNTLSWFRAEGYDTRGAKLGDDIKYWVEPGYGTFYATNPGNLTINSSAMVIETEFFVKDFFNSGGATNVTDFAMSIANGTLWSQNQPFENRPALNNPDVLRGLPNIEPNPIPLPRGNLGQGLIMNQNVTLSVPSGITIPQTVQSQGLNLGNTENRNEILDDTPAQFRTQTLPLTDNIRNVRDFSQFGMQVRTPAISNAEIANLFESITVPQGTKVYFWAKKPGVNVVHAKPVNYIQKICKRDFSIEEIVKPVCGSAVLMAQNIKTGEGATCINGKGRYLFKTLFYKDAAKQNKIPDTNITVQWTSTDPEGTFYAVMETQFGQQGSTPTPAGLGTKGTYVGGTTVIYQGGGQVQAKPYKIDGMLYTENTCNVQLDQCQNKCSTLRLTSQPSPIFTGQNATLYISPSTTQGTPLPSNVKINWSTNTGGKFTLQDGSREGSGMISTVGETPVKFKNATTAGTITAEVPATESYYAPACKESLEIKQTIVGQICKSLSASITDDAGRGAEASVLNPNKIYKLQAVATYDQANLGSTVTYNINPSYGSFISLPDSPALQNILILLINALSNEMKNGTVQLTSAILTTRLALPSPLSTLAVPDGTILYLATYNTVLDLPQVALTCQATGSTVPDCTKNYPGRGSTSVPTICKTLEIITPNRPWYVTPSDTRQPFSINVTTEPAGLQSQFYYHWKTSNGTWEVGLLEQTVLNKVTNALTFNQGSTPRVDVWASYDSAPDSKILNSAGNQICSDFMNAILPPPGGSNPPSGSWGGSPVTPSEIMPSITKGIYVSDPNKIKPLLNISSSDATQTLTFKSVFESGSTKYVTITEEGFKNGKNGKIEGTKTGTLDYKAMRIDVVEKSGAKYTILKTPNYENDKEDKLNEKNTDFGTPNETLTDYESKYNCNSPTREKNKICIDEIPTVKKSFATAVTNFKTGEAINFKNMRDRTKIIIKVQVENHTEINTITCQTLNPKKGCGEDFKNRISFIAEYASHRKISDYDTAKVVVICPYILFRQGGDAYFNSALQTGVDVGMCSPVKSSTGTGITPKILRERKTPNVGTPESTPVSLLDLPSHNVCRYSNTSNNIEGYQDALSNFSSTICEMKAEVADQWKEENINAAINANVIRIARWGENLTGISNLTSYNQLNLISNKGSGVFVKNGTLTIDGQNNTFKIEAMKSNDTIVVPAGQTYIIENGDLVINSNIVYGTTDYSDPKQIPSAAFIVLNGNIIISKDVTQIDGVLMAVNLDGKGDDGQIKSDGESYERLTINGSLFGNVLDLFKNRLAAGDPTKDEGSVTIRYDERILLNTPPGLGELINVQQSVVPN